MTKNDATLIVHALLAVSPSGGGSSPFTLARRLMTEFAIEPDWEQVGKMQQEAAAEIKGEG